MSDLPTISNKNKVELSDAAKYLVGFGVGVACTAMLMKKHQLRKMHHCHRKLSNGYPSTAIDHVVIRSRDKTNECKEFYRCLGFEIEREKESIEWEKTGRGQITFPMVRVNEKQAIDLFGSSMTDEKEGTVDHICLVMSADDHMNALKKLKANNVCVSKQFRAYGACGYGWSTYIYDPSGLYVEIRNYETNRWREVKEFASSMMED